MQTVESYTKNYKEIDLTKIFIKIKAKKKVLIVSVLTCFILGLIIVSLTPKEFRSETTIMVESNNSNMGGLLQQFGGLAGLNMGSLSKEESISPEVYPDILKSAPFLNDVLTQKVQLTQGDTSSILIVNYIKKNIHPSAFAILMDYTIGLPKKLFKSEDKLKDTTSFLKFGNEYYFSPNYLDFEKKLGGKISLQKGESQNIFKLSTQMPDPFVAAQINKLVVNCLERYIIDYHTQKAKNDLNFILIRHSEAESKYLTIQKSLALYKDKNKNTVLDIYRSEEQKLQADFNLAFNIYNNLSQQLEQAKIKVQEKTPVFKIINPSSISFKKVQPNVTVTLISFLFLGLCLGLIVILLRSYFK